MNVQWGCLRLRNKLKDVCCNFEFMEMKYMYVYGTWLQMFSMTILPRMHHISFHLIDWIWSHLLSDLPVRSQKCRRKFDMGEREFDNHPGTYDISQLIAVIRIINTFISNYNNGSWMMLIRSEGWTNFDKRLVQHDYLIWELKMLLLLNRTKLVLTLQHNSSSSSM